MFPICKICSILRYVPTNAPLGFRPSPRRFNVESTWCVCRVTTFIFFFFFEKIKCLSRANKPNNICKKYDFVKKKRFFIEFHLSSDNGQIFYIVESTFLSAIAVPFFNTNNFYRIPSSVNNSIFLDTLSCKILTTSLQQYVLDSTVGVFFCQKNYS